MQRKHFDLLCTTLGLTAGPQEAGNGFTSVSAVANNVRIFFEEERGLCSFAIGARSDLKPMCNVEEMASRFPRVRLLPEGHQRLALVEQRQFIESQWSTLQVMFSADHIAETRAWHRSAAAAYTEGLSHRK
jgi:hypothetical protein